MRKTIPAFVVLNTLAFVAESYAVSEEGGNLGAKAGFAKNDHSCEAAAIECDRSGTGYGIFAGYDFNRRLGLEVGITELGDSTAVYPEIRLEGALRTIDISAKYSRHLFGDSRVFAKLGAAYWQGEVKGWGVKVDGSGISPTFGVGIVFPFADQFSARVEYQYFAKVGDRDLGHTQPNLLALGVAWHFGGRTSDYAYSPYATRSLNTAAVAAPPAPSQAAAPNPPSQPSRQEAAPKEAPPGAAERASEPEMKAPPVVKDDRSNAGDQQQAQPQPAEAEEAVPAGPVVIDDHSNSPLFAKGSSVLKINYALEKVAVDLLRRPHLFVHIVVHTDDQGGNEQNRQLSIARAAKLADYLKWQGVNPDRISVEGRGKQNPIADKNSEVSRARSRRAEFFISETKIVP